MLNADVEVKRRSFTVKCALSVAPGERLALFGPSGAGKTTVLEAIAGLVPVSAGRVELGSRVLTGPGVLVPAWQRRVGLLRQDPGLFPHLSVRDNLRYGAARETAWHELDALASVLGVADLLAAMPARLSGGQAHRVALGRLLLAHCDAMLLDEPYSGLDLSLRRTLTSLVSALVEDRKVPALLVTHELADAQAFASTLAVIDAGRVLQTGSPSGVVLRPASRRVAELLGYLGFVPAAVGGSVAGVHPERVVPGADPGRGLVLTGTVTGHRPAGVSWEADLRIGDTLITCKLPGRPGSVATVTVLDPPYFGPDGELVSPRLATSSGSS